MIRMMAIWVRLGMMAATLVFALPARGQVVISEFMASSSAEFGLKDEDLATPDWIEIQNISTGAVNMLNWKLKDKTAVAEFDAVTGEMRNAKALRPSLNINISRDALFDIGADTIGMIVPGANIAVKLAKVALEQKKK